MRYSWSLLLKVEHIAVGNGAIDESNQRVCHRCRQRSLCPVKSYHTILPALRIRQCFFVLASFACLGVFSAGAQTLDSVIQSVRKRFPSVQQLATDELAGWLADSKRLAPSLVDARSAGEFSVSHLRDAANLTTVSEVESLVSPSRPVVVYCSVGYRSSALAQKLQKAGFANVYNLEGSIFKWANEGHPVFRGTREVEEVHAYNATWGKLLDQRLHPKQKTF